MYCRSVKTCIVHVYIQWKLQITSHSTWQIVNAFSSIGFLALLKLNTIKNAQFANALKVFKEFVSLQTHITVHVHKE